MYRDRCADSLIIKPAVIGRVRRQAVAANVTGDDLRSEGSASRPHMMHPPTALGGAEAMPDRLATGGGLIGGKLVS